MRDYKKLSKDELIKLLLASENKVKQLEDENEKLKVEKKELQIEFNKLLIKYENKQAILDKANKDKYYTTSEKLNKVNEENILNEAENVSNNRENCGRKKDSKNINNTIDKTNLRRIVRDFTEEELKQLEKEHKLVRIGEDLVVKLMKKPAVYEWVIIECPKYKDENEMIHQVELDDAFSKSIVTSSVVSDIINNKMNLGVPLERQSQYLISNGFEISSSNLANYMMRAANILEPIYNKMLEKLINNTVDVVHIDETPVEILDNKKERENSYMFVLTTTFWDNPIYIYDFSLTRKTTNIEKYLENYNGYITVDGYSGYDKFKKGGEKELKGVMMCWAHLRRKFVEADPHIFDKKKGKESCAEHVVHLINKVFEKEKEFKKKHLTIPQIYEERNKMNYISLLQSIKRYVDNLNPIQGTKLDDAVKYTKNNWVELTTHLKYGGLDLTNSIAERAVRPFAVARNSFLFCKTNNGATATGRLFSIVQTAKANGLSVEKYLNYIFDNISTKSADELLPWSESIPKDIKVI